MIDIVTKIIEGTKFRTTEEDIKNLADNMNLIKSRGLQKLNDRLISGGRNIYDTFSECNFATKLLINQPKENEVCYEPEGIQRPPDFRIIIGGVTYWIQMKRFSSLEMENRQDKALQRIKEGCEQISIGLFFDLQLSEEFKEENIAGLIEFLELKSKNAKEMEEFHFPNITRPLAVVKFWSPPKIPLPHLTLGSAGDMNVLNLTGLDAKQIKDSLVNAAGAFTWDSDAININLIAADADRKEDIDICDAIFGTEYVVVSGNRQGWSRQENGFFHENSYRNKVAGIITLKRKTPRLFSNYDSLLFINNNFKDRLEEIKILLPFTRIISHNIRPLGPHGNFRSSE